MSQAQEEENSETHTDGSITSNIVGRVRTSGTISFATCHEDTPSLERVREATLDTPLLEFVLWCVHTMGLSDKDLLTKNDLYFIHERLGFWIPWKTSSSPSANALRELNRVLSMFEAGES